MLSSSAKFKYRRMKRGGLEFVRWSAGCGGYGSFCVENSVYERLEICEWLGVGGRQFESVLCLGSWIH